MKLQSIVLAAAACMASSSSIAQSYHRVYVVESGYTSQPDYSNERDHRHVRAARSIGYERYDGSLGHSAPCDYRRPWLHERNHRKHERVGGAGPCHEIHRGEQLPRFYWGERHVVKNWKSHALSAPWRGYDWIRTGHDFVLVERDIGRVEKVVLMRHRRNR